VVSFCLWRWEWDMVTQNMSTQIKVIMLNNNGV
jgi:hypothetical protein